MPGKIDAQLNVRVKMRDGVELSTFVYIPEGKGPWPVMLCRTPYGAMCKGDGVYEWPDREYVYVGQDCRGRGLSEGDFSAWIQEVNDGEDMMKWLHSQVWCNGHVCMYGGSYPGGTQNGLALSGDNYLSCITPCLCGPECYHTMYNGGALRLRWQLGWLVGQCSERHLPLNAMDMAATGKVNKFWREALTHPTEDEFWQPSSMLLNLNRIKAPMFMRSGWFDLFIFGMLEQFAGVRKHAGSDAARKYSRLIVGPWPHDINRTNIGDVVYPDHAKILDLYEQEKAYMDYFTAERGDYNPEVAPLKIFVMGVNQWRDEYEWPLARTRWTKCFISSNGKANSCNGDGRLSFQSDPGASDCDKFKYDPMNPVPTCGGAWDFSERAGQHYQDEIEKRQDVLVYTGDVLKENLEITGKVEAHIFASSSAPDTDFTVKLVDCDENGRPLSITDGIIRARYRNNKPEGELLEPGKVYEFIIVCNPTSYTLLAGHRLRIEISSSNFPAFARNLNTAELPDSGVNMAVAEQQIMHCSEYQSYINLPIIPAKK